jgi:hypothetical protein
MKIGISAISLLLALTTAAQATGQINISGQVNIIGQVSMPTFSGTQQYTNIWVFDPPNGPGGANDNVNFMNDVFGNNAIAGASVPIAWNSIEMSLPTSTPCAPSDTCQPDPGLPGMYHTYTWTTTYDYTGPGSPIYQWINLKKVNILVNAQQSGATNPITPHYVTSSWWYNQFSPQQQDVINGINTPSCTSLPWTGTGGTVATWSGTTVTVNSTSCCSTMATQGPSLQTGDVIWVTSPTTNLDTPSGGSPVTVNNSGQFYYTASGTGMPAAQSLNYISAAQSWAVPYEYPFMSALKAFWAAVVAHYGPNYSLTYMTSTTNYFSKLNYFRFGGSVGTEWYPYCTSVLTSLPNYGYSMSGWTNYYQQMGNYLHSLGPPWQIIDSVNSAETPANYCYANTEAGYAVGWANRFGVTDGIGSQGLSVADYIACHQHSCLNGSSCTMGSYYSASNWYPLFQTYNTRGVPLQLQPIALSWPNDTTCANGCGPTTYSGDLQTFLYPFSTNEGTTDYEIYWRDLSLAYDVNYYCHFNTIPPPPPYSCNSSSSISLGGEITSSSQLLTFFQAVGQGNDPTACGSNTPQTGSMGDCGYAIKVNDAQGPH